MYLITKANALIGTKEDLLQALHVCLLARKDGNDLPLEIHKNNKVVCSFATVK